MGSRWCVTGWPAGGCKHDSVLLDPKLPKPDGIIARRVSATRSAYFPLRPLNLAIILVRAEVGLSMAQAIVSVVTNGSLNKPSLCLAWA